MNRNFKKCNIFYARSRLDKLNIIDLNGIVFILVAYKGAWIFVNMSVLQNETVYFVATHTNDYVIK